MPIFSQNNFSGLNNNVNPFNLPDGNIIRAVNYVSDPFSAKRKRPGYGTILSTLGAQVNTLWQWQQDNGTTMFYYAAAGSLISYSIQGTGAWTTAGNGTIANGGSISYDFLNNVMTICDGVGSTRYSTDGSTFTNTTGAPVAQWVAQYNSHLYLTSPGTNQLFYSCEFDPTNWTVGGTSDSSNFPIPGPGATVGLQSNNDRLLIFKQNGYMYRWDGNYLLDMSTQRGLTSPLSLASYDSNAFWVNREGIYGYSQVEPTILSNPVQNFFYNASGSGVADARFTIMPGAVHRYDYLLAMGTTTDNITGETIPNAVMKYDYRLNEFLMWQMNDFPTALASIIDTNGKKQLIFGNSSGQVFQMDSTKYDDAGQPISTVLEFVFHGGTLMEKDYYWFRALMNPGSEARISYACVNTLTKQDKLVWKDMGQAIDGVVEYRFDPSSARGRLLFIRITESGHAAPQELYGMELDWDVVVRRSRE